MPEIKHILVPTDGSGDACKAADMAGMLARAHDARVTVLSVLSDDLIMPLAWGGSVDPAVSPFSSKSVEEIRAALEQRTRDEALANTVSAVGESPGEVRATVEWGHPADTICRFAADNGIDLIVIGSHGRSGIGRVLLGSVSNAVANRAPCPVTIVR